jgi:predicted transcriptional regulator
MPTTHITDETSSMPTVLALDRKLQARLTALAEASSQQPAQLIEEAVREYVERQEYRNTRALEDLEAWRKFEASGRKGGISLDEVTPWLDSWGTDNELPPPSSMLAAK